MMTDAEFREWIHKHRFFGLGFRPVEDGCAIICGGDQIEKAVAEEIILRLRRYYDARSAEEIHQQCEAEYAAARAEEEEARDRARERESRLLPQSQPGWVYLIASGERYKIGKTINLESRLRSFQCGLPHTVQLIHATQTDDIGRLEKAWHQRFASKRITGEWFALDTDDVALFRTQEAAS